MLQYIHMPHLAGKKFSKRHTTATKASASLAKFLARLPEVEKIVIGEIKPVRVGPKRLKIQPVAAGLKLMIRDTSARQTVFVYTKQPKAVADAIDKYFEL